MGSDAFRNNLNHYIEFLSKGNFVIHDKLGRGTYIPEIYDMMRDFYQSDVVDYNYMRTTSPMMENWTPLIDTMTEAQVCAFITMIFRSEHFGEGTMLSFIENGSMQALCIRLLELQNQTSDSK